MRAPGGRDRVSFVLCSVPGTGHGTRPTVGPTTPFTQLSPLPPIPRGLAPGHALTVEMGLGPKIETWPAWPSGTQHPPPSHTQRHREKETQRQTRTLRHTVRCTHTWASFLSEILQRSQLLTCPLTSQLSPRVVLGKSWVSLTLGLSRCCVEGSGTQNGSVKEDGMVSALERPLNHFPPHPTWDPELSFIHSTNSTSHAGP